MALIDAVKLHMARLYQRWSEVFRLRGRLIAAVHAANRALHLDPMLAEAYISRGLALGTLGDTSAAIADFTAAVRITPRLATGYYWRGVARFKQRCFDEALGDFNLSLALAPSANAYVYRGAISAHDSNQPAAISDFSRALSLTPHDPYIYRLRANARTRLGDIHGALGDYLAYLRLTPQDREVILARMAVLQDRLRIGARSGQGRP